MTVAADAGPEGRCVVMLRSLECLYDEARRAKLGFIAHLLGVTIEAVKDELAGLSEKADRNPAALAPRSVLTVSMVLAALHELEDSEEELDSSPAFDKLRSN